MSESISLCLLLCPVPSLEVLTWCPLSGYSVTVIATLEEQIGANIRALRTAAGMTQTELGKALQPFIGGVGWTRQAVLKAEKGHRQFTAAELLALAAALGATWPQLFESADEVRLPSGKRMPPALIDALVSGTNKERDHTVRLLGSARALKRAHGDLTAYVLGLGVEVHELERAIHGAARVEASEGRGVVLDAIGDLGQAVSADWRRPPKKPSSAAFKAYIESGDK